MSVVSSLSKHGVFFVHAIFPSYLISYKGWCGHLFPVHISFRLFVPSFIFSRYTTLRAREEGQNLAFSSILWCPFKIGTPKRGEMGDFIYGDMEGLWPVSLI